MGRKSSCAPIVLATLTPHRQSAPVPEDDRSDTESHSEILVKPIELPVAPPVPLRPTEDADSPDTKPLPLGGRGVRLAYEVASLIAHSSDSTK